MSCVDGLLYLPLRLVRAALDKRAVGNSPLLKFEELVQHCLQVTRVRANCWVARQCRPQTPRRSQSHNARFADLDMVLPLAAASNATALMRVHSLAHTFRANEYTASNCNIKRLTR